MLASLLGALGLLACTSVADSDLGDPAITLLAPVEGGVVCGTPLVVEVEVTDMELVPWEEVPDDPQPGTGHVDISLNGQDAKMVWVTSTEIEDVADGEYQIKVELSNADHTPVTPYAGDLAYMTVSSDACGGDLE